MSAESQIKDPLYWSAGTWALAVVMGGAGGVVNWYARMKRGNYRRFQIVELLGEVFTSGFVGVGMFMVLASYDQPAAICAAASGVSGHMATRLLFLIENLIEARITGEVKGK